MNPVRASRLSMLRPLLAALGYVAAIAVLIVLVWSSVSDIFERRAKVTAASELLAQLEGRRGNAGATGAAPSGPVPTGSPFLEGQTLTVAGAALLQRVADAVTKVGGNVVSSQVDVQGVQAKDGYVSVIASCEVEQSAIQRLLYDLEAGMPFLFIEQFVAQSPQTTQAQPGSRMRLLLAVSGQWQGTR